MKLTVNLRHLAEHEVRLEGELPAEDLDLETLDEVTRVAQPLSYALEVRKFEAGLLAQGRLRLTLDCTCVRCLEPCQHPLELEGWTRYLPLEGEERVAVVNDCVDLTPFVREDILLAFPQHPLCDPECRGLPGNWAGQATRPPTGLAPEPGGAAAWAELNKLKF
jgi:uncharacterized protein